MYKQMAFLSFCLNEKFWIRNVKNVNVNTINVVLNAEFETYPLGMNVSLRILDNSKYFKTADIIVLFRDWKIGIWHSLLEIWFK